MPAHAMRRVSISTSSRTTAGPLLVLEAGGGSGLLGPLGIPQQTEVAGHIRPGGERPCFAGVEVRERHQVGFGALLVGAEQAPSSASSSLSSTVTGQRGDGHRHDRIRGRGGTEGIRDFPSPGLKAYAPVFSSG
ncbi:hypothetical protein [Streptomyces sp. S1]|uniref:hypothetical protein n=1 Tax=Streptomyces sp. S1 TaxID=718288 RepID=UPI003D758780